MQESVASTVGRAGNWLLEFGRKTNLMGYVMVILYDSVVTVCPYHEREIWALAHKLYMFVANGWQYGERILRYPIDTEINEGWSTKAQNPFLHTALQDKTWNPTPEKLAWIVNWLETQIQLYESNPALSVAHPCTA